MLLWWERDGRTRVAIFTSSRSATRASSPGPHAGWAPDAGDTVHAGRSAGGPAGRRARTRVHRHPAGQPGGAVRAGGDHRDPGLRRADGGAGAARHPAAAGGRTVAIISNVGGAGVLAADACTDLGLDGPPAARRDQAAAGTRSSPTAAPSAGRSTRSRRSRRRLPAGLEVLRPTRMCDAIIALVLPTAATGDLTPPSRRPGSASRSRPWCSASRKRSGSSTRGRQADTGLRLPGGRGGRMARAAAYGSGAPPPPAGTRISRRLGGPGADAGARLPLPRPEGGWLPPREATALLACYGIAPVPLTAVASADEAVAAAARTGGPVALKGDVEGLLHKTDAGAVRLDLRTEDDVRAAYEGLAAHFGASLREVSVQPMISGGTEVLVGVADDHMFGPLIVFGLGGIATNVLADHAARLAPLTTTDADTLISSVRAAPLLRGYRGTPAADLDALRDLLLRVSRLAEDLPEITELDLNPVIARPDGAHIVDARIKVMPYEPQDPFLRKLR